LALSLLAFALTPVAAMAQAPTDAQYRPSLQQIAGTGGGSASGGGGLPFTGLDVALLAAVAGGLLLAGLVLRRQRPEQSPKG
jgi:hypothetical protein